MSQAASENAPNKPVHLIYLMGTVIMFYLLQWSIDWIWGYFAPAPGEILLTSRDNRVSYPVCVYPLRTTWNGSGSATQATSYSCR